MNRIYPHVHHYLILVSIQSTQPGNPIFCHVPWFHTRNTLLWNLHWPIYHPIYIYRYGITVEPSSWGNIILVPQGTFIGKIELRITIYSKDRERGNGLDTKIGFWVLGVILWYCISTIGLISPYLSSHHLAINEWSSRCLKRGRCRKQPVTI